MYDDNPIELRIILSPLSGPHEHMNHEGDANTIYRALKNLPTNTITALREKLNDMDYDD